MWWGGRTEMYCRDVQTIHKLVTWSKLDYSIKNSSLNRIHQDSISEYSIGQRVDSGLLTR